MRLATRSLAKILRTSQADSRLTPNRRFKFHKRRQLLIRMHNETLSVVAMRVNNPDRSQLGING
jgi:hypothetical protein